MRRYDRSEYLKNFPPHPCPIPGCPNRDVDRAVLCPAHAKHQARTGSPTHPGLTLSQRDPAVKAVGLMIRAQLRAHDFATEQMVAELSQRLYNLQAASSGLPRLNEFRYRTPLVKAQAILYHLNRQRWISKVHPTTRTPKTERTWAVQRQLDLRGNDN